jgi:hypothetical protein
LKNYRQNSKNYRQNSKKKKKKKKQTIKNNLNFKPPSLKSGREKKEKKQMETTINTIPAELQNRLQKYIDDNPVKLDFDYRDELDKDQIIKVLENEEGLTELEDEIYENSLDWISENERYFIENELYEEFEEELNKYFENKNEAIEYLTENFYPTVSLNMDDLLNNTGNLTCLIPVYSNYDCTNSFDTMETSDYLKQVYKRVKTGIKKSDFMNEHINGAYGGSLFCFAFQTDLQNLIKLKAEFKKAKQILIPAGMQYGFFSSFQGSSSPFEKVTYREMKLNVKETGKEFNSKYDCIGLIADIEQHYSMADVFGDSNFIDEQTIKLIK